MLIKFIYQIFSVLDAFLHDSMKGFCGKFRSLKDNFPPKKYFTLNAKLLVFVLTCAVIHSADCAHLISVNVSSISNLMANKFEK